MYRIYQMLNGEFLVECQIQDGTERYRAASWEDAVKRLKLDAKAWNNAKIKTKDIKFYREEPIQTTKFIEISKPI